MAKPNEMTKHLVRFFDDLCDLNYLSLLADAQRKNMVREHTGAIEAGRSKFGEGTKRDFVGLAGRISVPNYLSSVRDVFPYGLNSGFNERYVSMIEEAGFRYQAQILASYFEAMETFLKEIAKTYYWNIRGQVALRKKKQFANAVRSASKIKGTPQYFAAYAEWLCRRNCDDFLADLKKHMDEFEEVQERGWNDFEVISFLKALGYVRHLVVHENGKVPEPCPSQYFPLVEQIAGTNLFHGQRTIMLNKAQLSGVCMRLAGTAHLLYCVLSDKFGLVRDFKPSQGVGKVPK